MKPGKNAVVIALLFFLFTGYSYGQTGIRWKDVRSGISFASLESQEPLQKVYVLRIDTRKKNLSFYSTARNPEYQPETSETDRQTTLDFLKENNLVVAINANFYNPFDSTTVRTKGASNVLGLAVSDGEVVSASQEGWPSFLVTKEGQCEIRVVAPDEPLDTIQEAVSGNAIIMKDEKVLEQGDKSLNPRTAVGISRNGRYVYFLTIDGRQKGYSMGATLEETGEWLKKVGAAEGLNLDGGGSTTMVARDKKGGTIVLNRPVGLGVPRTLRHNANGLGVRMTGNP